jgi:Bacterial PH domain
MGAILRFMAARSIDFGKFNTDKTDSRGVVLTVRPDMRLVKMSFLAPVVVLLVGGIIYLLPLPIDRQLINYLVMPFITMVAIGVAVYPVGMYEALSKAVFTVTDQYVEEEVGIIWKRTRRIPLSYVRDVTHDQNFIQAIFCVSDITVSATNGDKIVLNNLRGGASAREFLWKLVLSKSSS